LVRFAVRLVGGVQSVVGLWDADRQKLEFSEETSAHASFDTPFLAAVMHEAMVDNTVRLIDLRQSRRQPRRQSRGDNPQNDQPLETEVAYVVPVIKHQPLGILTVFLRYTSLFPDDDLEILRLLAESSATDLDYVRLLERRRALLDKLNTRTEQLEEANRELEAFAYTVSHDLRAPLRAVDGFSRIIYEDYRHLLPPDGQETLDLIIENSKQMGQLIDDLLRLSRLGRAEVIRTTIDMQELAKEVVGEQIRTAPHRSIEVKLDALPPAEANRSLMKQVLANLVSNAVKFTRACEHARIEIGSHQENGHPVYFVRDNGVGFDMQYANKLFGVFQRLQNPEDYEGTGVGLAIVQRIIRKHGGRVWAEAAPNQGAAFYFELGEAESE
jgi:two-component system sensor kinase